MFVWNNYCKFLFTFCFCLFLRAIKDDREVTSDDECNGDYETEWPEDTVAIREFDFNGSELG